MSAYWIGFCVLSVIALVISGFIIWIVLNRGGFGSMSELLGGIGLALVFALVCGSTGGFVFNFVWSILTAAGRVAS